MCASILATSGSPTMTRAVTMSHAFDAHASPGPPSKHQVAHNQACACKPA
jgi:hypothetical protein